MKACHGPCLQGRKSCPTPSACEVPEDAADTFLRDWSIFTIVVSILAVAMWCIAAVAAGV